MTALLAGAATCCRQAASPATGEKDLYTVEVPKGQTFDNMPKPSTHKSSDDIN